MVHSGEEIHVLSEDRYMVEVGKKQEDGWNGKKRMELS